MPGFFGSRALFDLSDQRIGVDFVFVDQDLDEVDQCKDAAETAAERQNDLEDTLLVLAHNEVVDADTAEEEADNSHQRLVLTGKVAGSCLLQRNAAIQADVGARLDFLAAVRAEFIARTGGNAAFQADRLAVVHKFTAILAIHNKPP